MLKCMCRLRLSNSVVAGPLYFGFSEQTTQQAIAALYTENELQAALQVGPRTCRQRHALYVVLRESKYASWLLYLAVHPLVLGHLAMEACMHLFNASLTFNLMT